MKNILKLLFAFTLLCFAFNVDAQRLKIGKQLQKCKDANGNPIADCIVVTDSLGNQTYAPLSNFCDACNFGGMSKAIQDFTVTEDSIITIVDVFGNTYIDTVGYPEMTFNETITTLVNTLNMGTLIGTYTSEDGISIPLYSPSYDLALDTDSSLVFTSTNGVNQTIDLKEIIETCILNTPSPTTTTVTILQNVQGLDSVIINVNGTNYIFEDTNLIETVTTITPLQAVGTPIATYTNEDGTITTIYSPVNSLTLSTDTSLVFTSSVGGAPQIIDLKSIIEQCIDDNATDVVVDVLTSVNGLDSVIITVDGAPFGFKDTNTISTFTDGTTATGISTTHDNGDGVTHVISIDTVKNSDGTTTINYILGGNSLSVGVCTDCPTLDSLHSNVMYITNVNGDTTGFTITKTNNDGSTSDVTINLPSAQDVEYNFDETTYPDSVCLVVNGVLQDCFSTNEPCDFAALGSNNGSALWKTTFKAVKDTTINEWHHVDSDCNVITLLDTICKTPLFPLVLEDKGITTAGNEICYNLPANDLSAGNDPIDITTVMITDKDCNPIGTTGTGTTGGTYTVDAITGEICYDGTGTVGQSDTIYYTVESQSGTTSINCAPVSTCVTCENKCDSLNYTYTPSQEAVMTICGGFSDCQSNAPTSDLLVEILDDSGNILEFSTAPYGSPISTFFSNTTLTSTTKSIFDADVTDQSQTIGTGCWDFSKFEYTTSNQLTTLSTDLGSQNLSVRYTLIDDDTKECPAPNVSCVVKLKIIEVYGVDNQIFNYQWDNKTLLGGARAQIPGYTLDPTYGTAPGTWVQIDTCLFRSTAICAAQSGGTWLPFNCNGGTVPQLVDVKYNGSNIGVVPAIPAVGVALNEFNHLFPAITSWASGVGSNTFLFNSVANSFNETLVTQCVNRFSRFGLQYVCKGEPYIEEFTFEACCAGGTTLNGRATGKFNKMYEF